MVLFGFVEFSSMIILLAHLIVKLKFEFFVVVEPGVLEGFFKNGDGLLFEVALAAAFGDSDKAFNEDNWLFEQ